MKSAAFGCSPPMTPSLISRSTRSSNEGRSSIGRGRHHRMWRTRGRGSAEGAAAVPAPACRADSRVARQPSSDRTPPGRGSPPLPECGGRPSAASRSPSPRHPRPPPARPGPPETAAAQGGARRESGRSRGWSRSAHRRLPARGRCRVGLRGGDRGFVFAGIARLTASIETMQPRDQRVGQRENVGPPVGDPLVVEHEHRRAAGVRAGDDVERVHTTGLQPGTYRPLRFTPPGRSPPGG